MWRERGNGAGPAEEPRRGPPPRRSSAFGHARPDEEVQMMVFTLDLERRLSLVASFSDPILLLKVDT